MLPRLSTTLNRCGAHTGASTSVASGRISYTFGLKGSSLSIDTACSSSLVAIHLSAREIKERESDRSLAAGVNLVLNPDRTATLTIAGTSEYIQFYLFCFK